MCVRLPVGSHRDLHELGCSVPASLNGSPNFAQRFFSGLQVVVLNYFGQMLMRAPTVATSS